ncbi:MAG: hypothetical protein AB2693_26235 [Candidatus Thiodiazotropha sp.]
MGTIEIFDAKQMKWVPYVPDFDKWKQHFKDIQDGYATPDRHGYFIVGAGSQHRRLRERDLKPNVQLVTPVAQGIEMAKSEMRDTEGRKNSNTRKRKKTSDRKVETNTKKKPRVQINDLIESQLYR